MRKSCILVAFTLLAFALHAQALGFLESGEYAWYHDRRGGTDLLRGYLYLDSSLGQHALLVRSVDALNLKNQGFFLMYLFEKEDGTLGIGEVEGDERTDAPEHLRALIDAANFATLRLRHSGEIGWATTIDDHWPEMDPPYTLHFDFGAALPLFGFSGIRHEDEATPSYRLIAAGMVPPGADPLDHFMKLPAAGGGTGSSPEPAAYGPAPTRTLSIGGWSLELDERWESHEEPGYRGYWFSPGSGRDAQVSVESMPIEPGTELGRFVPRVLKYTLLTYNIPPDYQSLRFEERDGRVWLRFSAVDRRSRRNLQVYAVKAEGGSFDLLNVSAFEDVWLANEAYFESILDSAR